MSIEERQARIGRLETAYGGKVICYVTSERRGMDTRIAPDVIPLLWRHLETIGEVEKLAVLLVSRGGDTLVPWQIVNLIRQYCHRFDVLAPYTAHSAATLICLGADTIYMTKSATLSSVDPTVANPFNPTDPTNPTAKVGISVEDVAAFMQLAKEQGITSEGELTQVFLSLTSHVHPLALGNVQRAHSQIRHLASELLKLHMDEEKDKATIGDLVKFLTEKFVHGHTINRREAKTIGLMIGDPAPELAAAMWALFEVYVQDLEMFEAFDPALLLGAADTAQIKIERAYIESAAHTDVFLSEGNLRRLPSGPVATDMLMPPRIQAPPGVTLAQVALDLSFEGWRSLR